MSFDYDYIIIGSGFGGSVSAMRLAEKGYSVLVVEKGRKYDQSNLPTSDWQIHKFLWLPLLRCFGFQNISFFRQVTVLSGVGVGGGSIVYGNTHMMPPDDFFRNAVWSDFNDWKRVLSPFYVLAKKMLGTTSDVPLHPEDKILKEVAKDMRVGGSFNSVNVGVYFGDPDKLADPYFNGWGPLRSGCTECAGCMTGCRYNAKNTLDKNYLHFAQHYGAHIISETKVRKIEHIRHGYRIHTRSSTGRWLSSRSITSRGLVISGGVLGTMDLLLKQKYKYNTLDLISSTLGKNIRTNSESLCGVSHANQKLNNGVAISSFFNPDEFTHVEVVKYNDASGLMGRLGTLAVGPGNGIVRIMKLIVQILRKPVDFLKVTFHFRGWGKNSIIFLVMQTLNSAMQMRWRRGLFGSRITLISDKNTKVPAYIPVGQQVMKNYAKKVEGIAQNVWPEVALNMPMTAHILGGCPMGTNSDNGVVDENFKVHNYDNLYVLDGSVIPCNLGVNPSLTITALAEYAMSRIPEKHNNKNIPLEKLIEKHPSGHLN